jgi:hypothetical protein
VDGIVALDDGSTDGSTELLEASDAVLELLRNPAERPLWDEVGNYRRLVETGLNHHPDWLVSIDADERLERDFRQRAETVIARGHALGLMAYALRLREVWDHPGFVRVDGLWGRKTVARLFRARPGAAFDERPLHAGKVPLQAFVRGRLPPADLNLYHLRMLAATDRRERRQRYEQLDPTARYQPAQGYAYLTDTAALRLARIPARRSYVD